MKKIVLALLLSFLWTLPAEAMVEQGEEKGTDYTMKYPLVYVDDSGAQDAINADINGYLDNFRQAMEENDFVVGGATTYAVKYEDEDVLSLTFTDYRNNGGAHGMYVVYGLNYDKHTGERLALDNFLQVTVEDLQGEVKKNLFDGGENRTVFHWNQTVRRVPEDYYLLGKGGIALIFQPYELGPYAAGAMTIRLDKAAVEHYNAVYRAE